MDPRELRMDKDGIRVTSYEGKRRGKPTNTARQQCDCPHCGEDCLVSCDTSCYSSCLENCGGEDPLMSQHYGSNYMIERSPEQWAILSQGSTDESLFQLFSSGLC